MSWCREDNHTHPLTLQHTPFAGAHCVCFHAADWWVLFLLRGASREIFILYGIHQVPQCPQLRWRAPSPCELSSAGCCTPNRRRGVAALCGAPLPTSELKGKKGGEWIKTVWNYTVKWDICRWSWLSFVFSWVACLDESGRAAASLHPSPAQRGLGFLPESRNLKRKAKPAETGAICQLYCDAALCLPWAHVFKHQLLKWLTTKCLKRRRLLAETAEETCESFKRRWGCPPGWCHTVAVFCRALLVPPCIHTHVQRMLI